MKTLQAFNRFPQVLTLGSFAALAAWIVVVPVSRAGVIPLFTITPSAITNDYGGKISATMIGLAPGQTVLVEKFADANTNSVIDGPDLLLRSFTVTDGQMPVVCGVTNINVPGDADGATNGQVRIDFFFGVGDQLDRAVGQFIYRVSTTNGVPLASATFNVAQRARTEGAIGRFTAGGVALSNGLVVLAAPNGSSAGVAGFTDTNGNYSFFIAPGTYVALAPAKSGFVSPVLPAVATVVSNQFVSNSVALTPATLTISGKVADLATGAGLSTVFLDARTSNQLFISAAVTDASGNYTMPVTGSTEWDLRPSDSLLVQSGYLAPRFRTPIIMATTNVPGVNFSVPKATALIYGSIIDNEGVPASLLNIGADNGLYRGSGESFPSNGNYAVGVLMGTNWPVGVDDLSTGPRGYTHYAGTNADLTSICSLRIDPIVTRINLSALKVVSNNQFQFTLNGVANQPYAVQATTNLSSWFLLLNTNPPSNSVTLLDNQATNASRIYRAFPTP